MKQALISEIVNQFTVQADPALKPRQEAYMRNQFPFCGVNQTKRLAIQKILFKQYPIDTFDELVWVVKQLWQLQIREYRYTAMDLMQKYAKLWEPETLTLFQWCIETDPWWDTLDDLAANCVGPLCKQYPELVAVIDQWIKSEVMWLRRAAIIHQLKYKKQTDAEKLFSYCAARMHEKEFFIRKAIGWALREYAKTDPQAVIAFVAEHQATLSPLSKREALRRVSVLL